MVHFVHHLESAHTILETLTLNTESSFLKETINLHLPGFPGCSDSEESDCGAGDPG